MPYRCSSAPVPTLRTLLRERTADQHRRLDSAPALAALLRPTLDEAGYAAALCRFAGAFASVEPLLARLEATRPATVPAYRPRLPALRQELAGRLAVPSGGEPLGLPPGRAACGYYLGLRYVLDGASQGARVIYPRLRQSLPQRAEASFAFWRCQLAVAADWPALCAWLSRAVADGDDAEAALCGAQAAFCRFIAAFEAAGVRS